MGLVIDFLTDDEDIVDLCTRYWSLDEQGCFVHRVADLLLPPGAATGRVAAFVAEHCHAYDSDILCQRCGQPCVIVTSRSEYLRRSRWSLPRTCDDCRRSEADREQAARDAAIEEKRSRIREHFDPGEQGTLTAPDELSFEEAIALLALFRLASPEGLGAMSPVQEADGILAPTPELATDLLLLLYRNGHIAVAPESQLSAFTDDGQRFYPLRVTWLPPVDGEGDPAGVMTSLGSVFREGAWPEEWSGEYLPFWRNVARHECLQYMRVCMEEHGFEFTAGDKTKHMLDGVLETYSPAQAYNFIWRAAKDAAAYLLRGNVSRRQAANSIVGSIQRMADRGLTEGWDVKPYRRDRRAPESTVSHVLYRVALRLRGAGIDHVPSAIAPDAAMPDGSPTLDDVSEEE